MRRLTLHLALFAICFTAAACAGRLTPAPLAPLPFPTDTVRSRIVSDGVVLRYIHSSAGPWAIHVLDVDLERCNIVVAVKGADSAAGRTKTTALLGQLATHEQVIGGVNGDFFSLASGRPIGLLIVDGRMLTPPVNQAALAFDSSGVPHIAVFTTSGASLSPFFPAEAVGGRPMLAHDSVVAAAADTTGQRSFNVGRNPRTAAGFARNGTRLILAVIDGRQKPYSDGMSLRETANLMLALGARDAINLDGGGSSTLVYADPDSAGRLRIANHVSDKQGERAVGDALALVRRCR
ncbi:MAG: phosphodiester glycosidase family protein [Gemmatimonadaceae bacterium]